MKKNFSHIIFCVLTFCNACGDKYTPPPTLPPPDDTAVVDKYQAIALNLNANGSFTVDDNLLNINLYGTNALYGVCLPQIAEGHFIAETSCTNVANKSGYGIAVINLKEGKPDFGNFTAITVVLEGNYPLIEAVDRQNGIDNVLDNTNTIAANKLASRYCLLLNAEQYSVPFTAVNGKVKILRNAISGFFHFYVGVEKNIDGVTKNDWVELAQSKDWSAQGQKFLVAPIAVTKTKDKTHSKFIDTKIDKFEPSDIDATSSFSAARREFVWAGFKGDAIVITFDKGTKTGQQGHKFVFWSEANYVPMWIMNNELAFCYEFVEVWSNKGVPGCFEPMSDRLKRFSGAEILENSPLRKVVKWDYTLVNPDYNLPAPGNQKPEVEEIYTIYPDGTGTRKITFRQKTDGGFRSHHELAEPMVISGSSTIPADHFGSPALKVSNAEEATFELLPSRNLNVETVKAWQEQIYTVNLNNAPNPFCVFAYSQNNKQTAPLAITPEFTWHNTHYQMSHFPTDRQPYLNGYDKSMADFPSQISHSSVIGIEAMENTDWTDDYLTDTNGRKYRVYISLIGLDMDKNNIAAQYTQTWLYKGTVQTSENCEFKEMDYAEKTFVLSKKAEGICNVVFSKNIINPVLKFENADLSNLNLKIDNRSFTDIITEKRGNDFYIFINKKIEAGSLIQIEN
ncbi:MAG: hypothetical protein LBS01_00705 [Prevotellaceae bacterium]|jgi:hypothetical protein|nr:hypothetical protein [Prevotellaceae bacterium]